MVSHSILLVEDHPLTLALTQDILENAGFDVLAASDAEECLALLAEYSPDLVLLDLHLPGKDGFQLIRELRATPATRDLVIVALIAPAMVEDEQRALDAGCDAYLSKPIKMRDLPAHVASFFEPTTDSVLPP
jgi:CheY-like chemotaxis protein